MARARVLVASRRVELLPLGRPTGIPSRGTGCTPGSLGPNMESEADLQSGRRVVVSGKE